jgi:stage III sporulation protein SpoIIIAA
MSKLTDPDWNPAEKPPGGVFQSFGSNLILVGEPGVGKTGIVEGFAQLLAEGRRS